MRKEYEEPFDEQASLERLEALGKQDRTVIEKQMTDEELFESLWINYSTDVEFLSDKEAYVITKPHFFHCLRESRKGMLTTDEVASLMRFYRGAMRNDSTMPTAESVIEQYLTERKGRG